MNIGKEQQEKQKNRNVILIVLALSLFAILFTTIFLVTLPHDAITGRIIQEEKYTQKIDETFTASTTKALAFVEPPGSIKISGSFTKEEGGYAKVWLEENDQKLLLFDSNTLDSHDAQKTTFYQVCEETCALADASVYALLEIEVYDASLEISKLAYTLSDEVNHQPAYKGPGELSIKSGESLEINLASYWEDTDNDVLTYLATAPENLEFVMTDHSIAIQTKPDMKGIFTLTLIANDGKDTIRQQIVLKIGTALESSELFKENVDIELVDKYDRAIGNVKSEEVIPGVYDIEIKADGLLSGDANQVVIEDLRSTEQQLQAKIDYTYDE